MKVKIILPSLVIASLLLAVGLKAHAQDVQINKNRKIKPFPDLTITAVDFDKVA